LGCPRSHNILRHRDADRPIDDVSGEMRAAYEDAVKLGCGHDKAARYVRIKDEDPKPDEEAA